MAKNVQLINRFAAAVKRITARICGPKSGQLPASTYIGSESLGNEYRYPIAGKTEA
jgi:hypothetical protein